MTLFLLVWAALAAPLDDARLAAGAWPDDYAAQVAHARAAAGAGAWQEALAAWRVAEALAPDSLEVHLGEAEALSALGDRRGAAAAARRAAEVAPDAAAAWDAVAATARWAPDEVRAHGVAYAADPVAGRACALADARLRVGDTLGAARLPLDGCAEALTRRLARPWTIWGGVWAIGVGQTGAETPYTAGVAGVASVGASWRDALWFGGTLRSLGWLGRDAGGGVEQHEGWLRLGGGHRGAGVEAVAGAGWSGEGQPTWAVGARAWVTAWATLSLDGAHTGHPTGPGWQAGGDLRLPLWRGLWASGGAGWTRLDTLDPVIRGPAVEVSQAAAARVGVGWVDERWSLTATGRFGAEISPLRMEGPTLMNLTSTLGHGGALDARASLGRGVWLQLGLDLAELRQDDATAGLMTAGSIGVVMQTGGR